jgi:single-strand DNA-binding protein
MATVRVEQRNAHLAGNVRLEFVKGREGQIAKATLTAISNNRRGSGDERAEESTAIQWTLWGKQAENAAEYLGKGSHLNIVGRLRNNNYQDADGEDVYGLGFTCEEIDYLDSKAESEARRTRQGGQGAQDQDGDSAASQPAEARKAGGRSRRARAQPQAQGAIA